MSENIKLNVNGREVPLNPFVKRAFSNVISALVNSLDKLPEKIEEIELKVVKKEKE